MPIYRLGTDIAFPPPEEAEPNGLLAVGGDLRPERLILAYTMGIFPWFDDERPILWHSPDPRMVLRPAELAVSRNLRRLLKQARFEVSLDTAFGQVIRSCAAAPRKHEAGTWITPDMIDAYERLFELGFAHSVEARLDGDLVGGLYGVSLGGCFFGESMFTTCDNASKVAFAKLVKQLQAWEFDIVDCQIYSEHLERFGATPWSRRDFLKALEVSLGRPTRRGRWSFDAAHEGVS